MTEQQNQPMTLAEFKAYRQSIKLMNENSHQPPQLWLILKRTGIGKHDFSPIGKLIFRGTALPFKLLTDWRRFRLYSSPPVHSLSTGLSTNL